MAFDILVVDDEADIRELVAGILQDESFVTRTARESDDALTQIATRRPNLVFLDIWLQGSRLDGLQLLDAMKAQHPELPIVMISGHGNIETDGAAIKQGAYAFIEQHGGTLALEDAPPAPGRTHGALIRITLPVGVRKPRSAAHEQPEPAAARGGA